MKNISRIAAVVLCLALLVTAVSAAPVPKKLENKIYRWYALPGKTAGERPSFEISEATLSQYGAYCIGNPDEKVIYLTFDIGYVNENVIKCIEALDAHNVKGAFFVLEHVVKNNSELIKKLAENGHTVANHTMKHRDMTVCTDFDAYSAEILGLEGLCKDKTGFEIAKFYRPPKGEFTQQNLEYNQKLGYKTIMWSLAYADWDNNKQPDPQKSLEKLLSRTHNGAVVLLHPTSATNAAILGNLLTEWEKMGYHFGILEELTA